MALYNRNDDAMVELNDFWLTIYGASEVFEDAWQQFGLGIIDAETLEKRLAFLEAGLVAFRDAFDAAFREDE